MAQTSFKSVAFDKKRLGFLSAHNARAWDERYRQPRYIEQFKGHEDPRGNVTVMRPLSWDDVEAAYLEKHDYGRAKRKVHHKAKLFREAVVVAQESTEAPQLEALLDGLEEQLGVTCLYAHLHRDEGYVFEDGSAKVNWHIHVGFTPLNVRTGVMAPLNRDAMRLAQTVCAEALGMERGVPLAETGKRKGLSHQDYRAMMAAQAQAHKLSDAVRAQQAEAARADNATAVAEAARVEAEALAGENRRLRAQLTQSGQATQANYQALKTLREREDLEPDVRLDAMGEYVAAVLGGYPPPTPPPPGSRQRHPKPAAARPVRLNAARAGTTPPISGPPPALDEDAGTPAHRWVAVEEWARAREIESTLKRTLALLGQADKEREEWKAKFETLQATSVTLARAIKSLPDTVQDLIGKAVARIQADGAVIGNALTRLKAAKGGTSRPASGQGQAGPPPGPDQTH